MIELIKIEAKRYITIHVNAPQTYEVEYNKEFKANILNNTNGSIYVSQSPEFVDGEVYNDFITLPENCIVNNVTTKSNKIYIKVNGSNVSGNIVIERCG